jgi:hypothetical protein
MPADDKDATPADPVQRWPVPGPRFGMPFILFPPGTPADEACKGMYEWIQRVRAEAGHVTPPPAESEAPAD